MENNNAQDQVNAGIVRILGEMSSAVSNVQSALTAQTDAITHTPDKKFTTRLQIAAVCAVFLVVSVSTFFTYEGQQDANRIGQQNQQTVRIYCEAVPENTECTVTGSLTAKASAILANCRIFANLAAVNPNTEQVKLLPSYAGCKALDF